MPAVALVARANSYRLHAFIQAAQCREIPIVLISDGDIRIAPSNTPSIRADLPDANLSANAIADQLRPHGVKSVIGCDDAVLEIASRVAKQLSLPCNSVESVRATRRKDLARSGLRRFGLLVPDCTVVDLGQEIHRQIERIQYPCVAKPVDLSASRGVIRADSRCELMNAIDRIRAILKKERANRSANERILVEGYISGSEHALEGFVSEGRLEVLCLFDKPDPLEGPFFEETYYVTPSRLDDRLQIEVQNIVSTACIGYGLNYGPIHAEVRVNEHGVWILEVAARTIGGDCGKLFQLATNCGLEEFVLARSCGQPIEPIKFTDAAGVLMIPVPESGIVRRVEGLSDAMEIEHVLEVRMDVRTGERLVEWPEGDKYPGFIFAKASTPQEVERALRQSHSMLNIVVMPEFPTKVEAGEVA